jgi:hypothetical protein
VRHCDAKAMVQPPFQEKNYSCDFDIVSTVQSHFPSLHVCTYGYLAIMLATLDSQKPTVQISCSNVYADQLFQFERQGNQWRNKVITQTIAKRTRLSYMVLKALKGNSSEANHRRTFRLGELVVEKIMEGDYILSRPKTWRLTRSLSVFSLRTKNLDNHVWSKT